jgi:RNA 2',3'-cyclic 3'-phosphodiesterase
MRIFFALGLASPWKEQEPPGRYIERALRHITLLFIREITEERITELIPSIPLPSFKIAPSGIFDKVVPLPYKRPNVISYHAHLYTHFEELKKYKNSLLSFLERRGIILKIQDKDFLPHASLCRRPFTIPEWRKEFSKLPFFGSKIVLYESLGNSNYRTLWRYDLISPFSEIEHTADIAFHIRGEKFFHLYVNGFIALAFAHEKLADYFLENEKIESLDDVIIALNKIITNLDIAEGSPFKAVSFQSSITHKENFLEWEMIVDV